MKRLSDQDSVKNLWNAVSAHKLNVLLENVVLKRPLCLHRKLYIENLQTKNRYTNRDKSL